MNPKRRKAMNKPLHDYTNQEFLKELGQRIVFGRLELETVPTEKTTYPQLFTEIWDNEWKDTSQPDYTGARITLSYCLIKAQQLRNKEATHE